MSERAPNPATVPASQLGPGADRALRRLHPRAVALWRLGALARGALLTGVAVAVELLVELPLPAGSVATSLAVGSVLVAAFLPPVKHERWRYALREEDLYLRHGVLFRTVSLVPYARIQHVDTRHGPLDRWLGLARVVVFTAGTRGAILAIPALAAAEAEAVRDRLAALSGAGDAV